jgi:probable phosphoglycerate mutase
MNATLLLIRHATNDAVSQWLPGRSDLRLNAEGRAQADRLVERLSRVRLDAIYSSPVHRARETAMPLAAARGLAIQALDDATEFSMGEWDGRRFADLNAEEGWRRFNTIRSLTRPRGGELMVEVQARFVAGLLRVAETHPGGTAAIFGHADPIRAAVVYFLGMPIDFFHRLDVAPASITAVGIGTDGPLVLKLNDTGGFHVA